MQHRHVQIGSTVFYQGASRSQAEWEAATDQLVDQARFLEAYDLAAVALQQFPSSRVLKQTSARALLRVGGIEAALRILEPLCSELHRPADEESLGLLASAHKGLWTLSGNPEEALRCRDLYWQAFRLSQGYWSGINAAAMSWVLRDTEAVGGLSVEVLNLCDNLERDAAGDDLYWIAATVGEAYLLQADTEKALSAYRRAATRVGRRYDHIVASLQQLRLLAKHGLSVPAELFSILKPPTVVVFSGHRIDSANREEPRFPPNIEETVHRAIEEELEKLDARIGYSSAASGSDLLFIEAMLVREAEVNIILPFDAEDFIKTSVAPAGKSWVRRFRHALELADRVDHVTEEPYLGANGLFGFAAVVSAGYAFLRARTLQTHPHLIVVWDERLTGAAGGTCDMVAQWPDEERLHVIPIGRLPRTATPPNWEGNRASGDNAPTGYVASTPPLPAYRRVVKAMLFADIVGYSKLDESSTPFFIYEFLERLAAKLPGEPEFVNSWGDAIFAVMENAMPLARYAFALRDSVCGTDWGELSLPNDLSVRIALHAGPVFEGRDPITRRDNFYGSHVNRAARIEPVTLPGCVYASGQFAAMLAVEQAAIKQGAQEAGEPFACEYVGTIALAKGFGPQAVYQVRSQHV